MLLRFALIWAFVISLPYLTVKIKQKVRREKDFAFDGDGGRRECAAENEPLLRDIVEKAAAKAGGTAVMRKGLKGRERARDKAAHDYEGDWGRVVDLTGGTIALPSNGDLADAIKAIRKNLPQGAEIARIKRLSDPGEGGYWDVKVSVRFANGGIGEIIIVDEDVNDAKFNRGGHELYDFQRILESDALKDDELCKELAAALHDIEVGIYSHNKTNAAKYQAAAWERAKATALSSLTRVQGVGTARISAEVIGRLKELLLGDHLHHPASPVSNPTPSFSFIQKDINKTSVNNGNNNAASVAQNRRNVKPNRTGAGTSAENPASPGEPGAKFYRIKAADGVYIIGELKVSDASALRTSYKEDPERRLTDPKLQNRVDDGQDRAAKIQKIAENPDPLQAAQIQSSAANGMIWTTSDGSGDVFIGNARATGLALAFERGHGEELAAHMRRMAEEHGLEIPDGVKNPIVHFELKRIEDNRADKPHELSVYDIVDMANEAPQGKLSAATVAASDAKALRGTEALGALVWRRDGTLDEEASASALGTISRTLRDTDGMFDKNHNLTREGKERIGRAVMVDLLGASEAGGEAWDFIDKTRELDAENEYHALKAAASELLHLADIPTKGIYDLRPALKEAIAEYTRWRREDEEARRKSGKDRRLWRGTSWKDYNAQGSLFGEMSKPAKQIADLLAKSREMRSFNKEDEESAAGQERAQGFIRDVLHEVVTTAMGENTETEDLWGRKPRTLAEVLEARRTADMEGNKVPGGRWSVAAKDAEETKRQYGAVVRRYTNADGTKKPGWMKAPNGKPTNLTERQWVQVRTPNFKRWFGDWETLAEATLSNTADTYEAARVVLDGLIGKPLTSKDGLTATLSGKSREKMMSGKAVGKSASLRVHLAAVANLEQLFSASEEMEREDGKKPNVKTMHRLYAPFMFDGGVYVAKLSVKEYTDATDNRIYTVEAIETEASDGILTPDNPESGTERPHQKTSAEIIAKLAEKVKRAENVSKIVDENGEPRVVWHGDADPSFTTFDNNKIQRGTGFWFTQFEGEA
ncbi:MAG: hypothetical protein IJ802_01380, partial [Kiritimatiellae bacterium]|nr:hypothetical protein [Kiritimatiellia bacterium]